MPDATNNVLILGAGPAGLALSVALGGRARILERDAQVGGLCRSIEFGGGVFDIGGHSFHSPHAEVVELVETLMAGHWHAQRRDARVSFRGELISYPFQQHFHGLSDRTVVDDCLRGQAEMRSPGSAANFEDWIVQRFGSGIAQHFMLPYNRKLWARDLRRIGSDWVGERIAGSQQPAEDKGPTRKPLQPDSVVAYPTEGGFGAIFERMATRCGPIELGRDIVRIDPHAKTAQATDGSSWRWNNLVSTMPLPLLLRAIDGCPAELIADADRLEFVSLKVLLILVAQPLADQPQRVYSADAHVPAHKIAFNHTSSPSLRARPAHAIMCEIAYSPEKPIGTDAELTEAMADWLVEARLVEARGDIAETRVLDIRYGYPVYTHERKAILEGIRRHLTPFGIHTIGRFGGWSYINSDGCIHESLQLARTFGTANFGANPG